MNATSNRGVKVWAYLLMPLLLAGFTYFASLGFHELICLLIPFSVFETFLLSVAITVSTQEKNATSDESEFLSIMEKLGYIEDVSKPFGVKMSGRYNSDPISLRVDERNYILGSSEIKGYPTRYILFSVGETSYYLLVRDGLNETFRLFHKG